MFWSFFVIYHRCLRVFLRHTFRHTVAPLRPGMGYNILSHVFVPVSINVFEAIKAWTGLPCGTFDETLTIEWTNLFQKDAKMIHYIRFSSFWGLVHFLGITSRIWALIPKEYFRPKNKENRELVIRARFGRRTVVWNSHAWPVKHNLNKMRNYMKGLERAS